MNPRTRIIETLRSTDEPQTIRQLAETIRMDRGTINHHVKKLKRLGVVDTSIKVTGKRGKPPMLVHLINPDALFAIQCPTCGQELP